MLVPPRKLLELNGISVQQLSQTSFDAPTTDSDQTVTWPLSSDPLIRQHIVTAANSFESCWTSSWHPETIPVEIWQYIFQLLVFADRHDSFGEPGGPTASNSFPDVKRTYNGLLSILPHEPWKVSQVCNHWRWISLSTPELWNVIQVTKASFHASSARYDAKWFMKVGELITTRLSRTSSSPLKISINVPYSVEGGQVLLRSLLPFRTQWETLHLHVPLQSLSEFAHLRKGDVPLLTSVKLLHEPYIRTLEQTENLELEGPAHPPNPYHICSISTSLRHLCTSSTSTSPLHATFCASLLELNIHQSPSDTWTTLQFLALCPQLRVLTLRGYGMTPNIPISPNPEVVLPELETLNLEHPIGRDLLLKMLNLPKLKSLWLGGRCDYDSTKLLREVNDLVARSELESLEYFILELQTHGLDTRTLVDFLELNPLLRRLCINDAWTIMNHPLVTSEFLRLLTLPPCAEDDVSEESPSRVICPQLTHISFINCSTFDCEVMSLFLKSRMKSCTSSRRVTDGSSDVQKLDNEPSLRVVDISCKERLAHRRITVDVLEALKAEGIKFSMTSAS